MKKVYIIVLLVIIIFTTILFIYYFNNFDTNLVDVNKIKTDSKYEDITYEKEEEFSEDIIGILIIDKIGLKATVKEGSSNEILKKYIGHIEGTSKYDGNIGLAAHNRGNEFSYFARLNELNKGDVVIYKTEFYERKYKVESIEVIFETDWTNLENTKENKLTMITCIANKRNQRLCVQAVEI